MQDKATIVFWLATLAGKEYGLIKVPLQDGWILGSAHKNAKKEVGQYQSILSLRLINDAYIMTKDSDIVLALKTKVPKTHFFNSEGC